MSDLDRPSTPGLIGDAIRQATGLFTAELQLARLEATEKLTVLIVSVVSLVGAAVFIIVALIFLLQGLVEYIVHLGWSRYAASFAVGGGIAAIALIAIIVAARNMSAARLKPNRTIRQVQQATEIVRSPR